MRWLRSISTDDNWDADVVIWGIIGTVLFACFMSFKEPDKWDVEKFGQGIGYILGGGGLGYAVKRYGEKAHGSDTDSQST